MQVPFGKKEKKRGNKTQTKYGCWSVAIGKGKRGGAKGV